MLPAWRFAFSTAGFGEDEGAHNRGAVARSMCGGSSSFFVLQVSLYDMWGLAPVS
jgi:hypothetical protein